ncbi:MAG: OmpW family protein [Alphaproteobacteria bacterium]
MKATSVKTSLSALALAVCATAFTATPALADGHDDGMMGGVFSSSFDGWADPHRFMIRGRAIGISPDEDADIDPIGGNVDADFAPTPELDFTYFLSDHFALELIAATSKHDVEAQGTTLGDVDLGDVWVLPPTLTLQYHFLPEGQVRPYVGAGINYTIFYNEDAPSALGSIDYDPSFGPALQAGFDIALTENWMFNADVKKIWINTDVDIPAAGVSADVDLDPWVFGVGIGYRF